MRKIVTLLLFLSAVTFSSITSVATVSDPELKVKSPRVIFLRPSMPGQPRSSVTVRVTAELVDLDEAEDPEEYYCLEQEWEWGDDTESTYSPDCDPYEEGVSEVDTRFSGSHQYRNPGTYRVWLRLRRAGKTVISGRANVQIRS